MFGAIVGDIVGSRFEHSPIKSKDFALFTDECRCTDDSVMTCAIAEGIMNGGDDDDFIDALKKYGRMFPSVGYGARFMRWVFSDSRKPIGSFGNGSAMRVSPCAWVMDCGFLARTGFLPIVGRELAERSIKVTHDDERGVKGGMAVADSIFLARYYFGGCHDEWTHSIADNPRECKRRIQDFVIRHYGYNLDLSLDRIRPSYRLDASCQGSVPEAIVCFLESVDFEDALRNAVSLGGDSDTQAAIAGSIAHAAYGIPDDIAKRALEFVPSPLRDVLERWNDYYHPYDNPHLFFEHHPRKE
ncbi:ADP-ribosylglycohydrolase family protein [Bifidobacterium gallicum]|uniref:ADP-ribosylglycohydrolase n=1 Tax=Bifidobacterium gallicum DSM 20093 = LMG 11596 TaxID=561180 RepID=D1NSI1_9BIFI|nr:ADP-ribosylglycohydrolase family protein [Bifidobacterium gallicum]EFA23633.1 ADP-ribosylglycohydrolase [Bifidobacterium gallicum DSM 20093 = LMG 11596]KFI58694.1 ADP-ribosylglycohydrolase [Bifidobacterium gallicum DSM 20093 = LMG 11596]